MTDSKELKARIGELTRELAANPKSKSFVALADTYRLAGELEDALEVALRGTWELPEFAAGYAAVGRVYAQRQVMAKAATAFQKAIEADPRCLDAYKGMARLQREQGDLAAAAAVVARALTVFPDDATLKQMQASLPAVAAAPTQSAVAATSARPGAAGMKPITTATIAEIYVEQGLYAQALEVYRELLAGAPQDAALLRKIAEIESLAKGGTQAAPAPAPVKKAAPVTPAEVAPAAPASTAVPPATAKTGDVVMETLNGWLEAIQARRSRV